jgi:hypothetical protein
MDEEESRKWIRALRKPRKTGGYAGKRHKELCRPPRAMRKLNDDEFSLIKLVISARAIAIGREKLLEAGTEDIILNNIILINNHQIYIVYIFGMQYKVTLFLKQNILVCKEKSTLSIHDPSPAIGNGGKRRKNLIGNDFLF